MLHNISDLGLRPSHRVAFLGYPSYNNTGDLLIYLGTKEFIRVNNINVVYAANYNNYCRENLRKKEVDFILFQGGGNFGDLYPDQQEFREKIILQCPEIRSVVLPQTLYFQNDANAKRSLGRLSSARTLDLMVRDRSSVAIVRQNSTLTPTLMPDMAHHLWDWFASLRAKPRSDSAPLVFIREDVEAGAIPSALGGVNSIDWRQANGIKLRVFNRLFRDIEKLEGVMHTSFSSEQAYYPICKSNVYGIAKRLSKHNVWITDRLHVVILGCLLDKYVFFVDNSYGKIGDYVSAWLSYFSPIGIINSDESAGEALKFAAEVRSVEPNATTRYKALGCVARV